MNYKYYFYLNLLRFPNPEWPINKKNLWVTQHCSWAVGLSQLGRICLQHGLAHRLVVTYEPLSRLVETCWDARSPLSCWFTEGSSHVLSSEYSWQILSWHKLSVQASGVCSTLAIGLLKASLRAQPSVWEGWGRTEEVSVIPSAKHSP